MCYRNDDGALAPHILEDIMNTLEQLKAAGERSLRGIRAPRGACNGNNFASKAKRDAKVREIDRALTAAIAKCSHPETNQNGN